jgi:hypothetical protein
MSRRPTGDARLAEVSAMVKQFAADHHELGEKYRQLGEEYVAAMGKIEQLHARIAALEQENERLRALCLA